MKSTPYSFSADVIRIIATLGVIVIHADVITASPTNYLGGISWWFANLSHSAAIVSVPLFVMLSGYLHLAKPQKYPKMIRKALLLTVLFFCWHAIFLLWNHWWRGSDLSMSSFARNLTFASVGHLYFLPLIIGLYVLTPALSVLYTQLSTQKQIILTTLLFILATTTTYIRYLVKAPLIPLVVYGLPYTAYYFLGGFFAYKSRKVSIPLLSIAALGLTILTALFVYHNYQLYPTNKLFWTESGGNYFWEHFSPNVVLLSLMSFTFLLQSLPTSSAPAFTRLVKIIAGTTFGIYLIHPIIAELLDHYAGMAIHLVQSHLWFYFIKRIVLIFALSFTAVSILRRLPLLRKVVSTRT